MLDSALTVTNMQQTTQVGKITIKNRKRYENKQLYRPFLCLHLQDVNAAWLLLVESELLKNIAGSGASGSQKSGSRDPVFIDSPIQTNTSTHFNIGGGSGSGGLEE